MKKRLQVLLKETSEAFQSPTLKQKEAYGRLSHTFCAASLIAAVSVMFSATEASLDVVARIGALVFWGVLLFIVGAVLSKGA